MKLELAGRTALITGATKGIGLAVAEALAAEGMNLAVGARNEKRVEELVTNLSQSGVEVWGKPVDVSNRGSITDWVQKASEKFGAIDVAISVPSAMVFQNTDDDWQSSFEIDLMGAIRLFDACRPHLEAAASRDDAAYIMISSIAALEADRISPYGAMKAALNHYAKGLAHEMAAKGVRVNAVSPGNIFIENGFWERIKSHAPDYFEQCLKSNPTGRMGAAAEVASQVAFLASPRSRFTTGANLVIDGTLSKRV